MYLYQVSLRPSDRVKTKAHTVDGLGHERRLLLVDRGTNTARHQQPDKSRVWIRGDSRSEYRSTRRQDAFVRDE
jgi:hypothetical protein